MAEKENTDTSCCFIGTPAMMEIDAGKWELRPWDKQLIEKTARLVSPLL